MKTFLFFYLNSLGLVLVLTQTRRPCLGPLTTDCKLTKAGHEYAGPVNVTRSGQTCQRWDSDQPHFSGYKKSILFPEGSAEAAGNKCRNPDSNYKDGVWCYTTNPEKDWEECDVKFCNCKLTQAGREYAGSLSVTRSGRTCQRWDSDKPHYSSFKNSTFYPEGSAEAAGNKCRNPDSNYIHGVWCYTTDPNRRWERCDVDFCNHGRMDTGSVTESIGTTSSSEWQTILLIIFAGLLILTTGIILYMCRKRCTAGNNGTTITKNTANPHPNSFYEDTGYDTLDLPLGSVVNRERPTLRGNNMHEYVGSRSMDLQTEEARIPDKSTEQSRKVNPYLDLAPDRALPPVYTTSLEEDYLSLQN